MFGFLGGAAFHNAKNWGFDPSIKANVYMLFIDIFPFFNLIFFLIFHTLKSAFMKKGFIKKAHIETMLGKKG